AVTEQLLTIMAEHELDFTQCFRYLVDQVATDPEHQTIADVFAAPDELVLWQQQWQQRLAGDAQEPEQRYQQMNSANPAFIARNHQVEVAIRAAEDQQNFAPFEALLKVVQSPWAYQPLLRSYALAPTAKQTVKNTFCGT
ncbi:MAG: protein adenylyltransferase SelO family protein, partial [Oceanospirillaceae bacterium]|nr:protein adenylyltransferase SelO family protein [Oceanospirillaceae bacterium]